MTPEDAALLLAPGEGESITAREGRDVTLLAVREQITITRSRYGPGERGPDPHVHREHVDSFYVLEGELAFSLGADAKEVRVGAGWFVAVPPNLVHSFLNDGDGDAHFLNFHTPDGGFAEFMRARRDGREGGFDSFDPPADRGLDASEATVTGPDDGERLESGPRVAYLKCDRPELFLAEFRIDGHLGGPDPHRHERQVDSFYVLEGSIDFTVEGEVHREGPGTLASAQPGVLHTFAHKGPGRARLLNLHAPEDGFADFMRRISA